MTLPCHAGPGHDHATDHGAPGWLCDRCWLAYLRIIHRAPVSLGGRAVVFERRVERPDAHLRMGVG